MNVRILVLKSLLRCGDYLLPEDILIAEVKPGSRLTDTEIKLAIDQLESEGLAAAITNKLDQKRRWQITDQGRLALANC